MWQPSPSVLASDVVPPVRPKGPLRGQKDAKLRVRAASVSIKEPRRGAAAQGAPRDPTRQLLCSQSSIPMMFGVRAPAFVVASRTRSIALDVRHSLKSHAAGTAVARHLAASALFSSFSVLPGNSIVSLGA
jgi:hypothetical protein